MDDLAGMTLRGVGPWPAPRVLKPALNFKKGDVVVTSGAEVRLLYLIEQGVLERFTWEESGESLDGIRTSGWLLGVVPALTGRRYGRIVAMTDCVLRPLPIGAFRDALADRAISRWLIAFLADELARQMARASALAAGSTRVLIEALFVELLAVAGKTLPNGGVRLTVDLPVVQVGRFVGASREHTSRVLAELEADNTLTRVRGWFTAPAGSPLLARLRAAPTGQV